MNIQVPIVRMSKDVKLPQYQSSEAAGVDLHAYLPDGGITLRPGERALIPTGLRMAIPGGYELQIRPRSGVAYKYGLTVLNAPGTIDSDYRGEIKVLVINLGQEDFVIEHQERIAQGVFAEVPQAVWQEMDELPETVRGSGGFGHTGN